MKKLAVGIAVAAALLLAPGRSLAGTSYGAVVSAAGQFVTQTIVVRQGAVVDFTNLDVRTHSVTATQAAPSGGPLFGSAYAAIGQTVQVAGTDTLEPNLAGYQFRCMLHPDMTGLLIVVPA